VTEANTALADSLRQEWAERGILVLNLIASPGAGKTTLIERTVQALAAEFKIAVIEGDLATSLDAERIIKAGAPAVQINTAGGCHLEARMVSQALEEIDTDDLDMLIIENVGNLVCPTTWDLGEDAKVAVVSLPEGDDKPLKYPGAFLKATAMVVNKIDLEPYLPASTEVMQENGLRINDGLQVFAVSCVTGEGLDAWYTWLRDRVADKKAQAAQERPNA
jgi:hydrogenase nickel incorporation protein HypB